jgi:hypothetical protein
VRCADRLILPVPPIAGTNRIGVHLPYRADDTPDDPGFAPEDMTGLTRTERDYIVPATDVKGNSVRLQCRAMPAVGRMLGDLILSRKFPFRTHGDAMRFFVVDGVKRLLREAGIDSVTTVYEAMEEMLRDEEFQIQFRDYFTHLRSVVEHYLDANAPGEARRVIAIARSKIGTMPEGYWRTRYTGELMERYGKLLDADGDGVEFSADEVAV